MKEEIITSAQKAQRQGVLDEAIYNGDLIEQLAFSTKSSAEGYLDIPIRDIIALRERDFYQAGSSWRQAVVGLDCYGWDDVRDSIVDYFTSDLRDNAFPAPGSSGELRIGFVGGAAYCRLGNHRLAAAKAWLAYNCGEDAFLKKASCYYKPIFPEVENLMERCLVDGLTMKYAFLSLDEGGKKYDCLRNANLRRFLCVEERGRLPEIFVIESDGKLSRIPNEGNFFRRIFNSGFYSKATSLNYEVVPSALIKLMLDKSKVINWFSNS
ncbi:hypothetical protein [Idiomarina loihiensis]|uniref:hypothetical protein n=1 Tax=Idiomarina loihiensis TaxID=135577 RepID=UPI00384DDE50